MNRGCITSTISRRVFSLLGIVLSVVLTISLVSTYNKTLPTTNAAVQLECSGLATPQVSLENQRDANGVPHQTKCVDPATGRISLPYAGTISASLAGNATVAKIDLTSQNTSIGSTLMYAVPVSGRYRFTCQAILTTAAGVSSTVPTCVVAWTDVDTNLTLSFPVSGNASGNSVGNFGGFLANGIFTAKTGTNINYSTGGYISNPGDAMLYSLHATLEYLGP